ncbi:hypothetical protein JCM8097_006050 [Rhodosporidiobolus ruineniae]
MSRAGSEPPPTRSMPYTSTPPPSRRPRPPPSVLSPLSSLRGDTNSPNDSFRSSASTYQPSLISHSSLSRLSSHRFLTLDTSSSSLPSFSVAPSHAGSLATTANPSGPTRFRRAHGRKPGQPHPPAVRSGNPDEVDLMALEDPDDVFRSFGVRDVRKLEKRASDAAAAKVAELRTMVGERYRDLLAAADSIVRMRSAADKLVDRLDSVEDAILGAGAAIQDTPTKPGPAARRPSRRSISPSRDRTFSSAPTLSLTIHLLLSIPSHVHSQLEGADFLSAARLEALGQVVYRQLSEYEPDLKEGEDEEEGPRSVKEAFPIVEKQHEALSALKPVVLRRAMGELRVWDAEPLTTAQTLAALVSLEDASPASALCTLLTARSDALSRLLATPASADDVATALQNVLTLILRTVETIAALFGSSSSASSAGEALLPALLHEVKHPSLPVQTGLPSATSPTSPTPPSPASSAPALSPILTSLPNYATLARYLPLSLLAFTPALSSASQALSAEEVEAKLQDWLQKEVERVVQGISGWIDHLSAAAQEAWGAKPLSSLRAVLLSTLSASSPSPSPASASTAALLLSRLLSLLESRLAASYTAQLVSLTSSVTPSIQTLLLALSPSSSDLESEAERTPAKFIFDAPLAFPSIPGSGSGPDLPFTTFLARVSQRVAGRSPLVDRGVVELEKRARAVQADLEGWLGAAEGAQPADRERLRREYLVAVRSALVGVADALEGVLGEVDAAGDVQGQVFVGNLASQVARSRGVVGGLWIGVTPQGDEERATLALWQSRLAAIQARSLEGWRKKAVEKAVKRLEEAMREGQDVAAGWGWDASRAFSSSSTDSTPFLPLSPSPPLLAALETLTSALHALPLPRLASGEVAASLLAAFAEEAKDVAGQFVGVLESEEKAKGTKGEKGEKDGEEREGERRREQARQAAWDVALLRRVVQGGKGDKVEGEDGWEQLEGRFLAIGLSADEDLAALSSALTSSTQTYLQRTQTLFAPLLPRPSPSSVPSSGTGAARSAALARLLPLGPPPAGQQQVATPGLVKPGPRLGLLPTRG